MSMSNPDIYNLQSELTKNWKTSLKNEEDLDYP